jgi:Na+/glutamate symporter
MMLMVKKGRDEVPLWQRLLITLVTMLLTSLLAGLLWRSLFNTDIPSYLSGVVGGVTAVPVWELLKRVQIR